MYIFKCMVCTNAAPGFFYFLCIKCFVIDLLYLGGESGSNDLKATVVVKTFACWCKMWCVCCLLLILMKKFVWLAEHEWVNVSNKFDLHQSNTWRDTEDGIRDEVWNMFAHNLKSVRGMRKTKTSGLVEIPKFKFDRGSIQKPSHGKR